MDAVAGVSSRGKLNSLRDILWLTLWLSLSLSLYSRGLPRILTCTLESGKRKEERRRVRCKKEWGGGWIWIERNDGSRFRLTSKKRWHPFLSSRRCHHSLISPTPSPNMHRHEEEWTIDDEDSVWAARQIIFRLVGTLFSIGEAYPRQELSFLSTLWLMVIWSL